MTRSNSSNQSITQSDELFFVVDENDRPLPPLPRKLVHGHGIWHRTTHVWIVNDRSEILCQQRSFDKELSPGKWESTFGGHIGPGESYHEGALRELNEELAIVADSEGLKHWKTLKHYDSQGVNNEFQGIYILNWSGDIDELHFDDGEVVQVAWHSPHEVLRLMLESDEWLGRNGYRLDLVRQLIKGELT